MNFQIFRKQCQFCPRGTYQDEELQATCKLCPTDHITAAQGSFSLSFFLQSVMTTFSSFKLSNVIKPFC